MRTFPAWIPTVYGVSKTKRLRALRGLAAPVRRLTPAARVDILLCFVAAVLYSIAWPTLHLTHDVPGGVQPIIAAVAALPVLMVRANPAAGWAVSAAGAFVFPLAFDRVNGYEYPWQVVHIMVLMVLLFAVSVRSPIRAVGVAWLFTSLLFFVDAPGQDGRGWAVGLTVLVLFGLLIRWLLSSRRQLAAQEEVTEVERTRRAILEEKARIARDLHDVVAHQMSLVVVQAQSAPYRVGNLSAEASAEFASIAATARDALNEVRGMLGVLRSDGHTAENAPVPGVGRIDELVARSRQAGMAVTFESRDVPEAMTDSAAIAIYRIVQESLANAARHAPGAAVRVRLVGDGDVVVLTVANDAPSGGATVSRNATGGHGVLGMRERAVAAGGALTAAPTADGGFEVCARIPAATMPPSAHVLSVSTVSPA
ncbi:MAG: sensor histidine kinase [Aldersonia sp.]|nr:sensor histidine kinase [Aldersonia sp.]